MSKTTYKQKVEECEQKMIKEFVNDGMHPVEADNIANLITHLCKPSKPEKIEELEYKPDSPWKEEYNWCSPHNHLMRKINELIKAHNED